MEIDIRQLMRIARRWAWLVALITVLAGVAAYAVASRQQPTYTAAAQVLVNPEQSTGEATEFSQIQASRGQAETYRQLVVTAPVLDRTIAALDLPDTRSTLADRVSASVITDTQLIEIEVEDGSAQLAADIANTLAGEFVTYVGELKVNRYEDQRAELEQEVERLQERRREIAAALDAASDAERATLQEEQVRIDQTLADLDASIRTLNRQIATSTTPLELANPAEVPAEPSSPRVLFMTLLGAFLGLLVSVATVAALEFSDNRVRSTEEMVELTAVPVLATVTDSNGIRAGTPLYALAEPGAQPAEAVRILRANLEFAAAAEQFRILTITSVDRGDGRSTVAANLAVAMAQTGRQVVLVDADLRSPGQHTIFGVDNSRGLASLLVNAQQRWTAAAHATAVPGLRIVPAGSLPSNPADLLASRRLREVLADMAADSDVVIVDVSPVLDVSDALALGAAADATLLVARRDPTRGAPVGGRGDRWQRHAPPGHRRQSRPQDNGCLLCLCPAASSGARGPGAS